MSYLIPAWEFSKEQKGIYRRNALEAGVQRAISLHLTRNRDDLIWRGIRSLDVGLGKWIVRRQHTGKIFTWIQYEIPCNIVIVIVSISIVSPLDLIANELQCYMGKSASTCKAVFSLSRLYAMAPFLKALKESAIEAQRFEKFESWPIMEGYFSEPIVYDPADTITIKLRCDSAKRMGLVLGGFTLEAIERTTI